MSLDHATKQHRHKLRHLFQRRLRGMHYIRAQRCVWQNACHTGRGLSRACSVAVCHVLMVVADQTVLMMVFWAETPTVAYPGVSLGDSPAVCTACSPGSPSFGVGHISPFGRRVLETKVWAGEPGEVWLVSQLWLLRTCCGLQWTYASHDVHFLCPTQAIQLATYDCVQLDKAGVCGSCDSRIRASRLLAGMITYSGATEKTHIASHSIRPFGDGSNQTIVVYRQTNPALQNVTLVRAQVHDQCMWMFGSWLIWPRSHLRYWLPGRLPVERNLRAFGSGIRLIQSASLMLEPGVSSSRFC